MLEDAECRDRADARVGSAEIDLVAELGREAHFHRISFADGIAKIKELFTGDEFLIQFNRFNALRWGFPDPAATAPARARPSRLDPVKESSIGRRVRIERARSGMSQAELAECIGISQTVLSRIETGERPLRQSERAAIECALGRAIDV